MPSVYNDYVLSTSLAQGWISAEQQSAAAHALSQLPGVSALDFLHEQQLLTSAQYDLLREAIADAQASHAGETASSATSQVTVGHTAVEPFAEGFAHVNDFLRYAQQLGASDVHLGVSAPPLARLHGRLQPMWAGVPNMEARHTESLIRGFLTDVQWKLLHEQRYLEFSYSVEGMGRFRTSVIHQRKGLDAVFRIVNSTVKSMDELGLPNVLKTLTKYHNGLVLITGPVGSGKSTTMAAMIDEVNRERRDHIITLEDPIEYLFDSKGCQVTQREVHTHTESFAAALRGALREDPDVIMVGEMRDLETIQLAITASETGHLVLGTLHTSSAARTLDRVLDAFPIEQQSQIRVMVAESLRGIVSQQLVPKADGNGRALAMEILINVPAVASLIRDAKTFMLPGVMQTGKRHGMRLMDDALLDLLNQGIISPDEAFDRGDQKRLFEPYLK
ncbi:MAG: type IV pili twitching motility protein PilT [Verrucomicrobia bacterium Tous-C9LFEB]|nr:MAG: type IV pili twitching motility protein PilT [Verrucomicrobia bacterium Tous-C9LFEB]